MSVVIALAGTIGSGKSTVADHLITKHGFQRVRFADPLKGMLSTLLLKQGCTPEYVKRCIEGDLKTKPIPELAGRTPRHAMQTLGTEWGRDRMSPDLWVACWKGQATQLLGKGVPVVAEDCRFFNEFDCVKEMKGLIWRIARSAHEATGHVSETEQMNFDVDSNLLNNGSINSLLIRVDQLLRTYKRKLLAAV